MENNLDAVIDCLRREKETFLEIEQLTESLLYVEPDALGPMIERRGALIEAAAALRGQALAACGTRPGMQAAVRLVTPDGETDAQARAAYEASLAVCAVWNRVQLCEQAVVERMSMEKRDLQEKIESLSQDTGQVAERYFQSVRTGLSDEMRDIRPKKYI